MDVVSLLVAVSVVCVSVLVAYVFYMSRPFGTFKKLGIPHEKPWPAFGNMPEMIKLGIVDFHHHLYKKYSNEKVYGIHDPGNLSLVVRDLDMIRDICIKNFNSFPNRRSLADDEPFGSMLTVLKDDHWRRVRNIVSPTFSSGKLKRMTPLIERTTLSLVANLGEMHARGESVELKELLSCFTMDVIASTGFGVEVNSLKDRESQFVKQAKQFVEGTGKVIGLLLLFPFAIKIFSKLGISFFSKERIKFFGSFVDEAMAGRREEARSKGRQDFLQLLVEVDESNLESGMEDSGLEGKCLTKNEIQGQSLIFILAGYETVSTALSFSFFLLAHHPEHCEKVQEEVDRILDGEFPTYESVQDMTYLDMCLNEAMRMFPPGFIVDRVSIEDCVVQGVTIPKDMSVIFPVMSIHYDPDLWEEPTKFDPERFNASNKSSRHPFAHLPFGQGPRNCIGMRLALLEMKIALAATLQEMTPVPCPKKSVYPVKLSKFRMVAEDGLWVKMVPRQKQTT